MVGVGYRKDRSFERSRIRFVEFEYYSNLLSQIKYLSRLISRFLNRSGETMTARIEFSQVEPTAYQAMLGLERYLHQSGLDNKLLSLIKVRASQINKCAFCIDMHTKEARKAGETEQRLYALSAWQETSFFTPQEKVALALTEAITLIAENSVSDELYDRVSRYFSQNEIVQILMAISTINTWNRIAITTRMIPGSYSVAEAV